MSQPITVWLVPAEPHRSELSQHIAQLSAEHEALPFVCHVTLFTTGAPPADASRNWSELVAEVASRHGPVTLTPTGTAHSAEFSKTLYYEFSIDPDLASLQADISQSAAPGSDFEFSPHMSLLYKDLAPEVRAKLASSHPPPPPFRADTLAVVIPGASGDWEDIAGWREIARYPLSLAVT